MPQTRQNTRLRRGGFCLGDLGTAVCCIKFATKSHERHPMPRASTEAMLGYRGQLTHVSLLIDAFPPGKGLLLCIQINNHLERRRKRTSEPTFDTVSCVICSNRVYSGEHPKPGWREIAVAHRYSIGALRYHQLTSRISSRVFTFRPRARAPGAKVSRSVWGCSGPLQGSFRDPMRIQISVDTGVRETLDMARSFDDRSVS